jgi:hypothetical protein
VVRTDHGLLRSWLTSMCPTKTNVSQKTCLSFFAANSQDNKNHVSRLQLQHSSLALVQFGSNSFLRVTSRIAQCLQGRIPDVTCQELVGGTLQLCVRVPQQDLGDSQHTGHPAGIRGLLVRRSLIWPNS